MEEILRIWATDGQTPQAIFDESVKRTACIARRGVLWLTRTKTDRGEACDREVIAYARESPHIPLLIVDKRNLWDWYIEHEVTLACARALLQLEGGRPKAWCFFHDDMAPPRASGWSQYLKEWLESPSQVMSFQAVHFWGDFETVRVDCHSCDAWHAWLVKEHPGLTWKKNGKWDTAFFPADKTGEWRCPWPALHFKGADKDWYLRSNSVRRGRHSRLMGIREGAVVTTFRAEMTWEEFEKLKYKRGMLREGTWREEVEHADLPV